jgi:hypothetical protein
MSSMNGYYDITDFFEVGDSDYTAAIRRAEAACEAAGGGVVYFPPGVFAVSGTQGSYTLPININASGVLWRGAGPGVSQIVGGFSTGVQPTFVSISSNVGFVSIQDLGFVGNGIIVDGAFSAPMIIFQEDTAHVKVTNCYFTSPSAAPNTTGICIEFLGTTDGEVSGCHFHNFGFSSDQRGDIYHTDAVLVAKDGNCVSIRAHKNHMENGGLGGVTARLGNESCDISHNFGTSVHGGIVEFWTNDTRVALNDITNTLDAGTQGCQGIDVANPNVFALIGNMSSLSQGDGIAMNGCSSGAVVGNSCWDNQQVGNDCGLQFIAQASAGAITKLNKGMAIVGNMSFDDGHSPVMPQQIGIHVFTTSDVLAYATSCVIVGNVTYGNSNKGVAEDNVDINITTRDDSNAVLGNNDWPERTHDLSLSPVSPTSFYQLRSVPFPSRCMLTECGIRITAGGSTRNVNGRKYFQLGFGAQDNIFSFVSDTTAGPWCFTSVITNNQDSSRLQAATSVFMYNQKVSAVVELPSLTIDTTADHPLELWVMVDDSRDSITSDYFVVERC